MTKIIALWNRIRYGSIDFQLEMDFGDYEDPYFNKIFSKKKEGDHISSSK